MEGTKQPPKVKAVYQAVIALFAEGADLNSLTVAEIAEMCVELLLQENMSVKPPLVCLPVTYAYGGTTSEYPKEE